MADSVRTHGAPTRVGDRVGVGEGDGDGVGDGVGDGHPIDPLSAVAGALAKQQLRGDRG